MKRFAIQRPLLTLPPLGDIGVWAQSTHIKHNLFHQSKLGTDVELQNTHIVLFKSSRDVMQVTTLSTQLGPGSEIIDWYRDATSVPFGHLLFDLSPRSDDRLRYCTKPDPFPQRIIYRTVWSSPKFWTMNTQNLSTLQVFQSFSHKCKNLFLQSCPKEFIRFLCQCIINLLEENLQSIKRNHVAKFQSEFRLLSLKRTTWKQRRDILASERGLQLIKYITPPVINHLSWYGVVCPRSCFCVQQNFDYPVSYGAGTSKVSTFTNPTYHVDSYKKEINKKLTSKADSLVDKILSCPRIKLSNSQNLILDGVETGSSLLDFAQQLRCKNADIPDIYFTLLDAAGLSSTLILNQDAKAKERGSRVPFKI